MPCCIQYSTTTWFILVGMIITGAARSLTVKLAYQSGFQAPLTITLLYLTGQALSLFAYIIQKKCRFSNNDNYNDVDDVLTPIGSLHGLRVESEKRIQERIHFIPWYLKPAFPALRWAALVYVDASVAEMLMSGIELTLSVVAARLFRKRRIGMARWSGVVLVSIGIIIIERSNSSKHEGEEASSPSENEEKQNNGGNTIINGPEKAFIGVILIVLQSILSVLQDIVEEIFMQAASFPPSMMLGMEGLYGLVVGLVIYFCVGNNNNNNDNNFITGIEDIHKTIQLLKGGEEQDEENNNGPLSVWLILFGFPILFFITGSFNIKATEVTSAMTRNVWKNFRTILIWIISLCIYYFGGSTTSNGYNNNTDYGEAWIFPQSLYILFGLTIMIVGISIYYWFKERTGTTTTSTNN